MLRHKFYATSMGCFAMRAIQRRKGTEGGSVSADVESHAQSKAFLARFLRFEPFNGLPRVSY
jgi:hypothetical protein